MRQFGLRTSKKLTSDPDAEYVNDCCEYGDVLLEMIKPEISRRMKIDLNRIEIGQEDWGWYLEFQKGEILYELDVSYQGNFDGKTREFGMIVEVERIQKGFFFNRKVAAEEKCKEFVEIIKMIAQENNLEIFEE